MNQKTRKLVVLLPGTLWLIIFFVAPLSIMLAYSLFERGLYGGIEYTLTLQNYIRVVDPLYLNPLLRSVKLALANTVLCLLIGYPLAYYIAKQSGRWKSILLFLVILPFWTNFLVRTYAWMIILRSEGLLNSFLMTFGIITTPLDILFTDKAVMIGLVYAYLPFMVLPLYASLEKLDRTLIDVAKDLGANEWQAFRQVVIPLTLPGIISGSILVFVPSFGDFIIPDILGGAKNIMIGNLIKNQFLHARDWPFGAALAFLVMTAVLLLLMVYIRYGLREDVTEKNIL